MAWTGRTPADAFGGSYQVDDLTTFLDLLFVAIVAFTLLFAPDYLEARGLPMAEFAAVLVFAMTGAMLISGSADLLVLFIGLELMVLPGYLLAGFAKRDALSTEGAIKYFLLGSFSSAIFLFGLAFIWGLTGSTRISDVATELGAIVDGTAPLSAGLAMGLAFLTTGVAFKIAAVPFHYWTPDAYQGSPTPVTGYLSVGPKIGAFALILRLFVGALGPLHADWLIVDRRPVDGHDDPRQRRRDHPGQRQADARVLVDRAHRLHARGAGRLGEHRRRPARIDGIEGLLFYGAAYSVMNLGAFAVIAALQRRRGVTSSIDTFAGLGRREPALAILMTLFLLSLTGIPPTAGFFAKAFVILAGVEVGGPAGVLAVIAVLNAAVAAFYYLRVVVYMFMREGSTDPGRVQKSGVMRAGLASAAFLTLAFGLYPEPLLLAVQRAAAALVF